MTSQSQAAHRGTQTVLVVDDIPYLRELASLFLARTARVVTASGGEAALELARRDRPDLIVCDLRMPGMDGAALCRAVRAHPDIASTPFVMLVAESGPGEREIAIRAGADDVLTKPLSRISLIDSVRGLLSAWHLRSLPRIPIEVPATLTVANREATGTVRNLSRGGAFVETRCKLAEHDEVALRFRLPGLRRMFAPSAEVVWCRRDFEGKGRAARTAAGDADPETVGVGVRFLRMDPPSLRGLDDFVYIQGEVR